MPTPVVIKSLSFVLCFALLCGPSMAQPVVMDSMIAKARNAILSSDYPTAIILYERCLHEAQRRKDWLNIGNAWVGMGIAHDKSGNCEEAVRHYFKALDAYQQAHNGKKEAGTLKNIGNIYRVVKTYDKAHNYLQLSIQKFASLKDSIGMANVSNDIGILLMDEARNDEALSYFKEVIGEYSAYAVPQVLAYAYNNIAIIYSKKGEYETAYANYHIALERMQSIGEEYGVGLILVNLGDLLNKQKKYNSALESSREGLKFAQKIGAKQLMASAYEYIATSYKQLSNYKQSNIYLDKLLSINDTVFSEQSAKSYAEMETRYQNEKKQKEIVLLKQENTINGMKLSAEQKTRYFLLAILLLTALASILLYRSYRLKKNLNKALNTTNKKLDEANHSKTKLLGIIAHDLRGPISQLFNFLQLQKDTSNQLSLPEQEKFSRKINTAAESLLDTMEDVLVWSKSQMEKFLVQPEEVNMQDLFTEIINLNATVIAAKQIQLTQAAAADLVLFTDPNLLKIVLRNSLSNALKFTPEKGRIELAAIERVSSVEITIRDTGKGMAPDQLRSLFEWSNSNGHSTGLGLKLAKEFTEKLKGTIAVHSQLSSGTELVLSFPCDAFADSIT
jgi:signal transduction histidine kinase